MKKMNGSLWLIRIFFVSLIFTGCSKGGDSATPAPPPPAPEPVVSADFDISVTGKAPNAALSLVNKSENATSFKWEFSQGAGIDTSVATTPTGLVIDKKGTFTVALTARRGNASKIITKSVVVDGFSAVVTYTDVKFGIHNLGTLPYMFSTSEGRLYQRSELNATTGPKIDLVFFKDGYNSLAFFMPPNYITFYKDLVIPGAQRTDVINYQEGTPQLTLEQFNGVVNDSLLGSLNIYDNHAYFGGNNPPNIVLFKNGAGRKGAINVKELRSDHMLMDIKVQKY